MKSNTHIGKREVWAPYTKKEEEHIQRLHAALTKILEPQCENCLFSWLTSAQVMMQEIWMEA